DWWLVASVSPPPPEFDGVALPPFPPPEASTASTSPVVVLEPVWPVAVADPLVLLTVPLLDTVLRFVTFTVAALLEPVPSEAPVVAEILPPLLRDVIAAPMPSPWALPLPAIAASPFEELTY